MYDLNSSTVRALNLDIKSALIQSLNAIPKLELNRSFVAVLFDGAEVLREYPWDYSVSLIDADGFVGQGYTWVCFHPEDLYEMLTTI
jgi:hypothetical protein